MAGNRPRAILALTAWLIGVASAQSQQPQSNSADQAVGLFSQACLRHLGNPTRVRQFLASHNVPPLSAEASAVFMRNSEGVGFDASNKITRMALISEDVGVCSVFAENADITRVDPLLQSTLERAGLKAHLSEERKRDGLTSRTYEFAFAGRPFFIVASTGNDPGRAFHVAITLSRKPE